MRSFNQQSNQIKRVACIIGTRPEIIKMAPVIFHLKKIPFLDVTIINSAQHRGMLDEMLRIFAINPTIDLDVMRTNQSLALLTSQLFERFGKIFSEHYDLVLVQGDTTTTLVASQVAFYNHLSVGHIEAGLRSYNFYHPFPEEMNRVFISKLATLHFAPTLLEENILLSEKIPKNRIFVTGNTVIDSLLAFAKKNIDLPLKLNKNKRLILITMHRRESFGDPLLHVFRALIQLTKLFDDIEIVYPVHPNPEVCKAAEQTLKGQQNIYLIPPVTYDVFVKLMSRSYLILSDSGGIQEEAPALNKPLLILREITERPLVVEMGVAKLVGTDENQIVTVTSALLSDPVQYQAMQKNISPYGDGLAAKRIVNAVTRFITAKDEVCCEW